MELFMVDRRGIYSTGDIVTPKKFADISPVEMSSLVDKLFPCGLAPQGEGYFINNAAKIYIKSEFIDWGLEFYRRGVFPQKPSRYTSLFAWDTPEKAKHFRLTNGKPSDKIFTIQTNSYHRGDMSLLRNDTSVLEFTYRMELYWSGKTFNLEPVWEYLCPLPVTIGKEIPD
ncbi:hypothetical protein JZC82_003913 [Salmonella enterica subsp. enterica serovar 4,[5],12:i:-]|nr:hypothetical protein [Salmonella enterica]EDQ4124187.1 hypothetical protein [Salmonella enterica subsp. enterica serovar Sandiego]EHB3664786.1 hypothetical protein [Salmonella enterica subsp. enterica serovar Bredeney]EHE1000080.1 hypothetical protein [Salmonella enterica subsp. enterica serovar 4,[5],12:i:-]EDS3152776.1 hypothetical protein [Salmonella enterica]